MTAPDRSYDPIRYQRGTRGFAAFVAGLTGLVVLGAALVVVPSLDLSPLVATWAVIIGTAAGLAHLVAVAGLIRGRRWAAQLIGYLAAAGIAVAAFGALVAATSLDISGADRASRVGFLLWMIGSWVVASRFAFKPFAFRPQAHRVMAHVPKPVPDARPTTGLRKRTVTRPAATAA